MIKVIGILTIVYSLLVFMIESVYDSYNRIAQISVSDNTTDDTKDQNL